MKKFLKTYKNKNEDKINYGLINKEYDDDLVQYIVDCCKSLEVLQQIEFLGFEHITNEADINTSEYIDAKSRSKGKGNKKDPTRYMYLQDSRYAELRLKFKLECNDEIEFITKKILVPVPDDRNYYTIKGNQYILLYQIVDNSTYTTKTSLVLKSMMPVVLKVAHLMNTTSHTSKSTEGDVYTAPTYTINIFGKDTDILLFYLAKFGLYRTLKYFSVDKVMCFTDTIDDEEKFVYFSINSKMYLKINNHLFQKYQYVKTIAFMLLSIIPSRATFDDLDNKGYWIDIIGVMGTTNKLVQFEKGLNTLIFFDRIIDDTIKRILKVHKINKLNIYSVLRWMIQNFVELKKKDNLNFDNKRLRCNEYIAALLVRTLNERVNRIIALGSKVTMNNIKEIFKFPGDIIVSQLHNSGLLRYDDRVNDMDYFTKLRVTMKGPNSLGANNENNIATKYRGLDPSMIGRLDLNVVGTSDPGTSAVLVPTCKTKGLYFDEKNEPEDFKFEFDKYLNSYINTEKDCLNISPTFESVESYYDLIDHCNTLNKTFDIQYYVSDDTMYTIEINVDDDIDI